MNYTISQGAAPEKRGNIHKITLIGLFAAISTVLMFFEMPIPFLPPFLKLDISGAPIYIMAFLCGPAPAVYVTLIKDLVHVLSTTTGGVGELADFLMLASFSIIAGNTYRWKHNRQGVAIGLLLGSAVSILVACLTNYFMLIPFYSKIMPIEAIIEACNAVNPAIDSILGYIYFGVVPFNIIKCAVLSFLTLLLYKRLSTFLRARMK